MVPILKKITKMVPVLCTCRKSRNVDTRSVIILKIDTRSVNILDFNFFLLRGNYRSSMDLQNIYRSSNDFQNYYRSSINITAFSTCA
jgi:hypothetical protein